MLTRKMKNHNASSHNHLSALPSLLNREECDPRTNGLSSTLLLSGGSNAEDGSICLFEVMAGDLFVFSLPLTAWLVAFVACL